MTELTDLQPYELGKADKEQLLTTYLADLTRYHDKNCRAYHKMLDAWAYQADRIDRWQEIPFLPVRLFKEYDLKSVRDEQIKKTMTSSGTGGQRVSKIYLDKETSACQTKVLAKIVSSFIGKKRLPMILLDTRAVLKNRSLFSARGAGLLGFSMFASDRFYALDEQMHLDFKGLEAFLAKHQGETILLYGFTFMIWQHFYQAVRHAAHRLDLSGGILIHGGGWKKLESEAVSKVQFKERLADACGICRVHDYYGMAEQTGSIYMECEYGHLHASVFSDITVRRALDFSEAQVGEEGILQTVSVIPKSYPGHSLLTEDRGVVLGEDDCPCGRKGKYFMVSGRIKHAEIRGCSDTYAAGF